MTRARRPRSPRPWIAAAACALALAAFAPAGTARADVAQIRAQVALRESPEENGRALMRIAAGVKFPILERSADGKWLRVLAGDRTGWVPAASVKVIAEKGKPAPTAAPLPPPETAPPPPASPSPAPAPPKPAPAPSRAPPSTAAPAPAPHTEPVPVVMPPHRPVRAEAWVEDSRYHAVAGGAVVVTQSRADVLDRPHDDAQRVGATRRGQRLPSSRTSRDGRFYLVEIEGGRSAWIAAAAVAPAPVEPAARDAAATAPESDAGARGAAHPSPFLAPAAPAPAPRAADLEEVAPTPPRVLLRVAAAAALGRLDQQLTSNGQGRFASYGDRTGLVGVEAALALDFGFAGSWIGGLAGTYRFLGGADVTARDADGGGTTLGVRSHDLELLARLGYRWRGLGGFTLAARAGLRMLLDLIDHDYRVPLPSERILGLAVGVALDAPRLAGRVGLSAAFDWIPLGARAQTPNLGDGDDDGTSGWNVALGASYAVTRALAIVAGGRYTRASTRFTGRAERDPTITAGDRTTDAAALTLGLRYTR